MGLCRNLAMINEQAVARLSLKFFRDDDELDSFNYVVLETSAGVYALQLYDHQPVPGYVLVGMENAQSQKQQIRAFLAVTGLNPADLTWRVIDDLTD